jgi:hypothetical protein
MDFHLDQFWRFEVPELDRTFDTYEAMKAAIEASYKGVQAANRRKVNIAAISENGKKFLVTGVHAGHGKLITSPKQERFGRDDLFVETKLVTQALAEKRRLQHDVARVDGLLKLHRLDYHGYRTFHISMHDSEIKRLEKVVASATKLKDTPLQDALVKIKVDKDLED